jgi:hypothetical protein
MVQQIYNLIHTSVLRLHDQACWPQRAQTFFQKLFTGGFNLLVAMSGCNRSSRCPLGQTCQNDRSGIAVVSVFFVNVIAM